MDFRALRASAEDAMRATRRDVAALSPQGVQDLVYELQVHQIELEMQNESLRSTQRELEQSQAQYQRLFDRAPVCYVILDGGGVVVAANAAALRLFDRSRSNLIGRKLTGLMSSHDANVFHQQLAIAHHTPTASCEVRVQSTDAVWRDVRMDIGFAPHGESDYLIVIADISERTRHIEEMERLNDQLASHSLALEAHNRLLKTEIELRTESEVQRCELESRLRASERFESLGRLAAGIAHDFNNLLVGVIGNVEILLLTPGLNEEWRSPLSLIKRAGNHASELTRQLLEFAGKGTLNVSLVDVSELAAENIELLRTRLPHGVELRLEAGLELPSIIADRSQINQVVMNLLTNGIEAMECGGVVSIRTSERTLSREALASFQHNNTVNPGDFLLLEVHDTGQGIDASTLTRVFDPFFSTKFSGRGLGLASVMGIVQSHRGALRVQAEPDEGTRFEVAFPLPPTTRTVARRQPSRAPDWNWAGTGSVLLIEDDEAVRAVVHRLLSHLGFRVVAADGGAAGLDMFRRAEADFKLVVLDWSMPGFSGEQVLKALRKQDRKLPVILLSGYGTGDLVPYDSFVIRAQKPLTLTQLQDAVCQAIGKPRVHTY